MKKLPIILSCVSIAAVIALAIVTLVSNKPAEQEEPAAEEAAVPAIVYFQLDKVMVEYQMSIDLNATFNTKASSI